jgi:hypothetical protein
MGKILEYNNFNAAPADDDLLFFSDASDTTSNPKTYRLKISDLNKKRNVDAATSAGLLLRDDSSTFGIKIHDGGNVGVGPGAATTPGALLSVRGAADSNLTLANFLNPSATTNGKYQQIIFGTDAANDKSVVFRYYYSTTDDASTLRIQSYEDAASDPQNEIGFHLKGDGNVGIGKINPAYPLDVKGTVVSHGAYPLILDPSTGEIKSNSTTTLNFNKSANANVTFMYYDSDGSTVNPALSIKYSNKRIAIGNTAPDAKLHVLDTANGTDVLIQNSTNGAVLELRRDSGTTTSNSLYISNTTSGWGLGAAITAGATTVNISSTGQLALKNTTFSYDLTVASGSSDPISSQFKSDSTAGARILVECNGAQPATQDNLIGFPIKQSGGAREVGWMAGYFRRSSANYFGIHYSSDNTPITSDFAFHGTLASNLFYIDTNGNTTVKGNVGADAYYDKGGTTVGNYCRGRFIQTYSYRYFYAQANQRWTPLFSEPVATGNNYNHDGGTTPDKSMCSKAPMAGRVTRIDVSFANTINNNGVSAFVYSGADAPAADLSSSNAAYTNTIDLGSAVTEGDYTIGYNDFIEASRTHLDFAAGEFLMLALENDTGNANATVVVTVEFNVPDNLGA